MSIYIKGMEMPDRCAVCWLMDGEDSWCTAMRGRHLTQDFRYGIKDKPEWCPLVEIPPHGRLIDADALAVHKFVGAEHDISIVTDLPGEHIGLGSDTSSRRSCWTK